jgi:hypothetical protein
MYVRSGREVEKPMKQVGPGPNCSIEKIPNLSNALLQGVMEEDKEQDASSDQGGKEELLTEKVQPTQSDKLQL